jgi:hypothetical protein
LGDDQYCTVIEGSDEHDLPIAIPGLVQIDDLGRLRQRLDFGARCRAINLLPLSVCSTLLSVRTVQPFDRK